MVMSLGIFLYYCRKTIGRGTFGKVKMAIHKITG